MTPASRPPLELTPDLALAYLRELSCDALAGCVLDACGGRLAGPEVPAAARLVLARRLVAGTRLRAEGSRRRLLAAGSGEHVVVVATGPHALAELVFCDLETVLGALAAGGGKPRCAPRGPVSKPTETGVGADPQLQDACARLLRVLVPTAAG